MPPGRDCSGSAGCSQPRRDPEAPAQPVPAGREASWKKLETGPPLRADTVIYERGQALCAST